MNSLYLKETETETILKLDNVKIKGIMEYCIRRTAETNLIELSLKLNVIPKEMLIESEKANLK